MTRLTWTERKYHSGVDRGVVYSRDGSVELWNGLISVTEKPTDIRQRVRYREGVRVLNHRAEDSLAATVECFTYPDWILSSRLAFDMSYRVQTSGGYEIHLVYNAMAYTTSRTYAQNETTPFTFYISTKPRQMPLLRAPSSHLIIDTSAAYPPAIAEFEKVLYGDEMGDPRLPSPEEIIEIFDVNALFTVVDNGDGTATISAPDEVFEWLSSTQAVVDWPYVERIADDTVRIRNW